MAAVGTAISDRDSRPIADVSISSHADRFTGLVDRTFIPLLLDTRAQIEKDLEIIDLAIRDL